MIASGNPWIIDLRNLVFNHHIGSQSNSLRNLSLTFCELNACLFKLFICDVEAVHDFLQKEECAEESAIVFQCLCSVFGVIQVFLIVPSIESDNLAYPFFNILTEIWQIFSHSHVSFNLSDETKKRIADLVYLIFEVDILVNQSEGILTVFLPFHLNRLAVDGHAHIRLILLITGQ